MTVALNNCEKSGDLYYILAETFKKIDDYQNYRSNLELAIKNHQTLSVPVSVLKEKLKKIKA